MSSPASPLVSGEDAESRRVGKSRRAKAIFSAYLGFMMDTYAIFIPTIALVPAIAYFQLGADPATAALFTSITLGATLLGRPIGAFLFGALADRIGRQRIGFVTIFGFGTITILIACLPGAQMVGAPLAMGLLLLLRFLDGIFLGGEYTAATPLAVEYAPPKRRGLFGGVVQSAAGAGQVLAALVTAITLTVALPGDINAAYTQWGWRIPFIVGGIIAILTAIFLRREVPDSDVQRAAKRVKSPLKTLFTRGPNLSALLQVFVIMSGVFFLINLIGGVLGPSVLIRNADVVSPSTFTTITIISGALGILGYIGSGALSDAIGRKRALIVGAVYALIAGPAAIMLIGSGTLHSVALIGLLYALAGLSLGAVAGIAPSYFNERFPTAVRSSGWGIGYSTAVVIPSFVAFYIAGIEQVLPAGSGGAVMWFVGCALVFVGLALGPETRGIDLTSIPDGEAQKLPAGV